MFTRIVLMIVKQIRRSLNRYKKKRQVYSLNSLFVLIDTETNRLNIVLQLRGIFGINKLFEC